MWFVTDYRDPKEIARGFPTALAQYLFDTSLCFVIRDGVCLTDRETSADLGNDELMLSELVACPIVLAGIHHTRPMAPFLGATVSDSGIASARVWIDFEPYRETRHRRRFLTMMAQSFATFLFLYFPSVVALEIPFELDATRADSGHAVQDGRSLLQRT